MDTRMKPEMLWAHLRLEAWGKWTNEWSGAWPAATVLHKVIECGINGAASTNGSGALRGVELPEAVLHTDFAVAKLLVAERRVVRLYYTKWMTLEKIAVRVKINSSKCERLLKTARLHVTEVLEELEQTAEMPYLIRPMNFRPA